MLKKPDRRRASTDVRLELRRQMQLLHAQGKTHLEIAQITGYTRTYVSTMLKRMTSAPSLLEGMSRGGRPQGSLRALSAKEERRAQTLICGKYPDQLSLPFALWTRAAIRELIRKEFDIRLSIRGVGEYVARWGYTPQKAARRAYERDDAAVKDWLSIEYPKIRARAKRQNAEICWGDETGVRSDESRHRGYAPPGQTPIVKIPARRRSLSMIAAVTNQGKVRFMIYPGGLSPQRLIEFMRRLIKDAQRKVFLILDNLNVHKAKRVREWLEENAHRIEVFYLPPYSPELNPTEYFNGDLKGEIQRGRPPKDVKDLKRTMLSHSRRIQKSPTRVRAYFKNKNIRYAA
ncbi:MAG TPA: IS630 family transposase [Steroidobacter sp.]|uniref:IS630 family transposase n=1 Tax=Steroidobacter sp. TaxID=1978227 RepID=UPI002EDB02D8